jgi:hypothetical protein
VYAWVNGPSTCYNVLACFYFGEPFMAERSLDRRDFHKLTAAALGGLSAGAMAGCSRSGLAPSSSAAELHLCRGLNDCKGLGKGSANACRGQGACATAKEHSCAAQNDCKGLGGCGQTVGTNACKGKGGCAVPLMPTAWETLRKKKEAEWGEKKVDFGAAPSKMD